MQLKTPGSRRRSARLVARRSLLTLMAVFVLSACAGPDNPYEPFPEPDFAVFVSEIQLLATNHCAFVGCHGAYALALTLYAPGHLRAEPSTPGNPLDDKRLTYGELTWNYDSLRLRLLNEPSADDSRLLRKCLDPEEGGITHAGAVVVFAKPTDADYLTFRDWIAGGIVNNP